MTNLGMTRTQLSRIGNYQRFCKKYIPQLDHPKFLVVWLAKTLPDYCIFQKEYYYRGTLIMYIPSLCSLNPYFEAVLGEKFK